MKVAEEITYLRKKCKKNQNTLNRKSEHEELREILNYLENLQEYLKIRLLSPFLQAILLNLFFNQVLSFQISPYQQQAYPR